METFKQQTTRLLFIEPLCSEEFKSKVCIPYFRDIYKDLAERSDHKSKGINKLTIMNYCQLPTLIAERLFAVWDKNRNSYLD